jgi:3-phenylpropionate/trans-cinnamate dioxygenase ferredoxin subunit
MSDFVHIADLAELPDPGRRLVEIDERLVLLFRRGNQVWALDDMCTHDGGPLGEGDWEGFEVTCPRHGARFDIRDGRALSMPATRPTASHEVRISDGRIEVRLKDA